jgi:rhodanese-related sulfurtransferase
MDDIIVGPERFLDKSKEYHIICQSGGRSSRICYILKGKGFNVINVSGGTGRYRGNLER